MRLQWAALCLALLSACATSEAIDQRGGRPPTWPSLSRFSGEREFQTYIETVTRSARSLHSGSGKQDQEVSCPPDQPDCLELNDSIVVTGSRIAAQSATVNTAITNVQTAGVDEGDIVKMVGRFLIVLQDGRLFSVDTGIGDASMAFVDRANVYRRRDADVWYDEILVHENRIVVTGYSYEEESTEFTVFSLNDEGRFTREGAYFLSSNDYYDGDNYATRLVNGNLVIYTPLGGLAPREQPHWPVVRRWLSENEQGARTTIGRSLFSARDIYRPVQETYAPTVHTISVCPLGSPRAGDELECRSTAIVGPERREFYVSNHHVYLWLFPGYGDHAQADCDANKPGGFDNAAPSAIYQIDLASGQPRALFVRGAPNDQFGMEAAANDFHALAIWVDARCDLPDDLPVRFLSTPLTAFSTRPQTLQRQQFTSLPSVGGHGIENRFTAGHLVYGGRGERSSYAFEGAGSRTGRVVVAASNTPSAAVMIEAPHEIIRIESIGEDAVLTGYSNADALSISVLDLRTTPRISDTVRLPHRYESEGRSHAFNFTIGADGAGLMGLPTAQAQWRSGRWVWDSESSDVSFLSLTSTGRLISLGVLLTRRNAIHGTYRCEVSCIDWYGNTRPIFVNGRVLALSGVELIEGAVESAQIVERRRINLSAPPPRQARGAKQPDRAGH